MQLPTHEHEACPVSTLPDILLHGAYIWVLDYITHASIPLTSPDDAHHCPAPCHEGECPPCDRSTNVQCQCGRASVRVVCVEVERMANYQCQHVCNKKKSCGRHRCHVRCCTVRGTKASYRSFGSVIFWWMPRDLGQLCVHYRVVSVSRGIL